MYFNKQELQAFIGIARRWPGATVDNVYMPHLKRYIKVVVHPDSRQWQLDYDGTISKLPKRLS